MLQGSLQHLLLLNHPCPLHPPLLTQQMTTIGWGLIAPWVCPLFLLNIYLQTNYPSLSAPASKDHLVNVTLVYPSATAVPTGRGKAVSKKSKITKMDAISLDSIMHVDFVRGLSSAPPIPAGIRSFRWNSAGFRWNRIWHKALLIYLFRCFPFQGNSGGFQNLHQNVSQNGQERHSTGMFICLLLICHG